jgi:hypothetical protein
LPYSFKCRVVPSLVRLFPALSLLQYQYISA